MWKLKGQCLLWGWNGSRGKRALVALWGRVDGGMGSSPQDHQEVALLVPQTQIFHSSGPGMGALKPHTGIYMPPP